MDNLRYDAGQLSDALNDMEGKIKTLRELIDVANSRAENLTVDIFGMSRQERFDASMEIWRLLSRINSAATWIDVHKGAAQRYTNSILSEISEDA